MKESLVGILKLAYEEFKDITPAFLYHLGRVVGISLYNEITYKYEPKNIEEAVNYLKALLALYGEGIIESVKRVEDGYEIRIRELIECVIQKRFSLTFGSHYYRGLLSGFFEKHLGKKVKVVEIECMLKSGDLCTFLIKTY